MAAPGKLPENTAKARSEAELLAEIDKVAAQSDERDMDADDWIQANRLMKALRSEGLSAKYPARYFA